MSGKPAKLYCLDHKARKTRESGSAQSPLTSYMHTSFSADSTISTWIQAEPRSFDFDAEATCVIHPSTTC